MVNTADNPVVVATAAPEGGRGAVGADATMVEHRWPAMLVAAQALLIFVPLAVLGAAIDWPGSLDDPAEIALPNLLDNEVAVRVGYLLYLLYSVLFLPVAIIVYRWMTDRAIAGRPATASLGMQIAVGMAVASALARSIGIVRWLSTMLPMAERWEVASEAERTVIPAQFTSLNDYGGTIGEVLGVSVFAAIWLAVTVFGRSSDRPRWIAASGAVVAVLLLAPAVELAGVDAGALVSVSSLAITVWLGVVAVAMFRSSRRKGAT